MPENTMYNLYQAGCTSVWCYKGLSHTVLWPTGVNLSMDRFAFYLTFKGVCFCEPFLLCIMVMH